MRRAFTYVQEVQLETGRVIAERVTCFWSPEHPTTKPGVATTARVQVTTRTKKDAVAVGDAVLVA